jgi:predicted alpha/beta superfamily hydrolase
MTRGLVLALALAACGGSPDAPVTAAGGGGAGGGGAGGAGGSAGSRLDELLAALRADRDGALLAQSRAEGWPAPVDGGALVVSADAALDHVGGDADGWAGTAMQADEGFHWLVVPLSAGHRYKLTGGGAWAADPWSRAYGYDEFGELSLYEPPGAHLERWPEVSDAAVGARTVRVWVPAASPTHVLYVHDGQNLFDPGAPWGGWQLDASAPEAMLVVGVDNTAARFDDYTHVPDDIGGGPIGGAADAYADFLAVTVRGLVDERYGEPPIAGVMGSSLGGLVSFHVARRHARSFAFAASLSGTMGWGSIGLDNETMIERFADAGHGAVALYLDSGGGGDCVDADLDGIEDDGDGTDNYCENRQLEAALVAAGYEHDVDLWHWWEPGASHDEAAWAARVWRPLGIFASLR